MARMFCIFLGLTIFSTCLHAQIEEEDYKTIYGSDYKEACAFVESHKETFRKIFPDSLEFAFATATIFPELIRYSMVRDLLETKMLEIFYIESGSESVDFSIGRFQMKPSFVEKLELCISNYETLKELENTIQLDQKNETSKRSMRLERLKNLEWQMKYLKTFLAVVRKQLGEDFPSKPKEALLLFATAYNHGFEYNQAELAERANFKSFPYGTKYPGEQHSYTAIAMGYFKATYPVYFSN